MSTAIRNESKSTSGGHSHVDLGCVSTTNSQAKSSLVQLFITSEGSFE